MKILALDLGTKTGFCFGDSFDAGNNLNQKNHGTKDFGLKSTDGPGVRFLNFHIWLRKLIKEQEPDWLYYEDVKRHVGTIAAHVYGGLLSQVQMICEAEKVAYIGIGVGTIKKHATGKGNAKKPQMIDAALRYGLTPIDDNDADAICLWYLACEGV